jgi:hypothetical protein
MLSPPLIDHHSLVVEDTADAKQFLLCLEVGSIVGGSVEPVAVGKPFSSE